MEGEGFGRSSVERVQGFAFVEFPSVLPALSPAHVAYGLSRYLDKDERDESQGVRMRLAHFAKGAVDGGEPETDTVEEEREEQEISPAGISSRRHGKATSKEEHEEELG